MFAMIKKLTDGVLSVERLSTVLRFESWLRFLTLILGIHVEFAPSYSYDDCSSWAGNCGFLVVRFDVILNILLRLFGAEGE